MKDLTFFKDNGVDVSKFIQVKNPTFSWNITDQKFEDGTPLPVGTETKVYVLERMMVHPDHLEKFANHDGLIAWKPSEGEDNIRFAQLANNKI